MWTRPCFAVALALLTTYCARPSGPTPPQAPAQPTLRVFSFSAQQANPRADQRLGPQLAFVDPRVAPRGVLVVYLHGSGDPRVCGAFHHGAMLAGFGFHVFSPCYEAGYGIGNCDDDRSACRLEALDGVDHHPFVTVTRPNSAEQRVVDGLRYLHRQMPTGHWLQFLDGDRPRWNVIIASGISHGASSAAVLAQHRQVKRVVMLAGPLDRQQPWLAKPSRTPAERYYGFTHTADPQHAGHLEAFATLQIPGPAVSVDDNAPPYQGSHRLMSAAPTEDGHLAVERGHFSPKNAKTEAFLPAWQYLYGHH